LWWSELKRKEDPSTPDWEQEPVAQKSKLPSLIEGEKSGSQEKGTVSRKEGKVNR